MDKLVEDVRRRQRIALVTLKDFQATFMVDPMNALEWSGDVFHAAGMHRACQTVLNMVAVAEESGAGDVYSVVREGLAREVLTLATTVHRGVAEERNLVCREYMAALSRIFRANFGEQGL